MPETAIFYDLNALELAEQYDSLDFETVHQSWQSYWPKSDVRVLDVGAGSGRDARWLTSQGCSVVAIEPAKALRELGISNSSSEITWLDDELPQLPHVANQTQLFDLILVSAVWMHLTVEQRRMSLKTLVSCLSDAGKIVITLRHGEFMDGRVAYEVSVIELNELALDSGLVVCSVDDGEDSLQRNNVFWQTVVLKKQ